MQSWVVEDSSRCMLEIDWQETQLGLFRKIQSTFHLGGDKERLKGGSFSLEMPWLSPGLTCFNNLAVRQKAAWFSA